MCSSDLKFFIFSFLFACTSVAFAMPDTVTVPVFRQYFHDKVDNEQKMCDKLDGKLDNQMRFGSNEEVNLRVSDVLFRKIDDLQQWVEANNNIDKNNDKIRFLGYIESVLRLFRTSWKNKEINPNEFPFLIETFSNILKSQEKSESIVSYISPLDYPVAKICTDVFTDNIDHKEAEKLVYFKYCTLHPDIILSSIRPYVNEPFADSLIAIACRHNPAQLYSYAQSTKTPEGKLIHKIGRAHV